MKVSRIMLALAVATVLPPLCATAAEVNVGDTRAQVITALGAPKGGISSGSYELLTYERGKVELRDGKVVTTDLISAEQAEMNRQLRAEQQAAAERDAAAARAKRIAEGTEVRRTKLDDAAFTALPAAQRVAFWQNFKKWYPEVPLGDEYTVALRELEQDLTARRLAQAQDQRIVELERRVADAEQRAQQAEQQKTVIVDGYTYGYPYGYLPVSRRYGPSCYVEPPPAPRYVHYRRGAAAPISYGEAYALRHSNNANVTPKAAPPSGGSAIRYDGGDVSFTIRGW